MEITYTIEAFPEDCPVQGMAMASGDDAIDKEYEDQIISRLGSGDMWAWCCVVVGAEIELDNGVKVYGDATLGCVTADGEQDFMENSGYYEDMKDEAKQSLVVELARICESSIYAANILREMGELK